MEAQTQPAPGYYIWEVPGKPITVHLNLDVLDRLLPEVMRGFGAVPKRGAEVGGVLIGSVELGDLSIVRVDDYEAVECGYKRGPSYLFDDELALFKDARDRWAPGESRPAYAVGYFRSHTREGFSLAAEDIALLDRFFPKPWNVALLIRPYGTKVSPAGFFFREKGKFQESTPLEFPFRRRELTGEEAPPRRSMVDRRPREREPRHPQDAAFSEVPAHGVYAPTDLERPQPRSQPIPQNSPPYAVTMPPRSRVQSRVWLPLSFIFLLLGVLLGFGAALFVVPKASGNAAGNFSLGLSVAKAGDNLNVRWAREAPAVHAAQRGILEIEDGGFKKSVDLDPAQLENGSVIYRNSSNDVKLRLIVYPRPRVSVIETMEWQP